MKQKICLLGFVFLLSFVAVNAQTFYYYGGQKVELTVDRSCVYVLATDELVNSSELRGLFERFNVEQDSSGSTRELVKLRFKSAPVARDYSNFVTSLKGNKHITYVFPFFERAGVR